LNTNDLADVVEAEARKIEVEYASSDKQDKGDDANINSSTEANTEEQSQKLSDSEKSDDTDANKPAETDEQEPENSEKEKDEPDDKSEAKDEPTKEKDKPEGIPDDVLRRELERRGLTVSNKQQDEQKRTQSERDAAADRLLAKPPEVDEAGWQRLSQEERYIYNQLPYIEARGKDGNVVRVKTPEQLPQGFEFASDQERQRFFSIELPSLSYKAEQLGQYVEQAKRDYAEKQAQAERDDMIVRDIRRAQDAGIIAQFEGKDADTSADSPVTRQIAEVLDYQAKMEKQGDPVSFMVAAKLWHADKASAEAKAQAESAKKESPLDRQRKEAAAHVGKDGANKPGKGAMKDDGVRFGVNDSPSDVGNYYADLIERGSNG
jgi:hypothetical protein